MPRPKGSKKDKNQSNKLILTSSSSSSSLPSSQISIPLSNINCSNDFINDDINWIKTPIVNKGGRPKKTEIINGNDDSIITTNSPTSSSSEISGGRVVVNPAVLRYLEQNRINKTNNETEEFFNKNISMDVNEGKDENLFDDLLKSFAVQESIIKNDDSPMILTPSLILSNEQYISVNELIEFDKFIQDDLCTCSTEFLTSARLAEWILTHQQSAKFETISLLN